MQWLLPEGLEINFFVYVALAQFRHLEEHLPRLKSPLHRRFNLTWIYVQFFHHLLCFHLVLDQNTVHYFTLRRIPLFSSGPLTRQPAITITFESVVVLRSKDERGSVFEALALIRSHRRLRFIPKYLSDLGRIRIFEFYALLEVYCVAWINLDVSEFLSYLLNFFATH